MNECLFQHHQLERLSFPHWVTFASLLKINWPIFVWISFGRHLIFTAQSGTEILCFWPQPFETPPHGFQTGPCPPTPTHLVTARCWVPRTACMGCSSTSSVWSLALVGLGCRWTHKCPRAGWSQTVFSRRCHIQSSLPTLAHRPRCPRDSATLTKLVGPELPHFHPPQRVPTSHPYLPLTQSGWRTFRRKIS